jgi:hypothetical protein
MTLALWAALGGTAYGGTVTSGSVLTSTKAAIAQQTGVHVVFRANSGSSPTTEKIVADVGVTTGEETVSEGQSHLAVRVTPGYAYVSGDSSGLTTIFGLTAAAAKKVGSDWVSWKAGTSQYANLKADVTFAAVTALPPESEGYEAVHRPHQAGSRCRARCEQPALVVVHLLAQAVGVDAHVVGLGSVARPPDVLEDHVMCAHLAGVRAR